MTTDSSHGLSFPHFNRYAMIPLGLAVSAISLASVNHKQKMIDTLCSAVSSIATGIIGAWSQNPDAVIGVTAGGFLVLQTFSKPSAIAQNLAISAVASTSLVALAKSSVDPFVLIIGLMTVMPLAPALVAYKYHHAYYSELIASAETGNEGAITKLMTDVKYFLSTETNKKRAGKVLISFAKKLYAKGDPESKNKALMILALCFSGGLNVSKNTNGAMLCARRMNTKETPELIANCDPNWWNGPVTSDPVIERLIDFYLGIKE